MKKNASTVSNEETIISPTDEKQISRLGVDLTNENICCELFISAETYCVFFLNILEFNHI